MFFLCAILSLLFTYIKQNKWFKIKIFYSYKFGWFVCEFITIYLLLPGSRSTFPEVDPDPVLAKWYGSNRIRIRNTVQKHIVLVLNFPSNFGYQCFGSGSGWIRIIWLGPDPLSRKQIRGSGSALKWIASETPLLLIFMRTSHDFDWFCLPDSTHETDPEQRPKTKRIRDTNKNT